MEHTGNQGCSQNIANRLSWHASAKRLHLLFGNEVALHDFRLIDLHRAIATGPQSQNRDERQRLQARALDMRKLYGFLKGVEHGEQAHKGCLAKKRDCNDHAVRLRVALRHSTLVPRHKFLVGIYAAQLQNRVADRGLHQHRDIASSDHLHHHFAHWHAEHVLR